MKYDDSACLSWKEILSLVDKYHKVNSFLVELVTLIRKNFILPKSLCVCIVRYIGEEGMAQGSKEALQHGKVEGLEVKTMQSSQGGSTASIRVVPHPSR